MKKPLEDLGLPANILALLEGFPAQTPSFPGTASGKDDERLIPGGPSSSDLLRKTFEDNRSDIESVVQEVVRVRQKASAASILLEGLTPMQNAISSALTQVNSIGSDVAGSVVDFFSPGPALLNASVCSVDNIYGQVTLPYANNPQSQILRSAGYGARPGTIVRYARVPRGSATSANAATFVYDETDPESFFAVDGRLDTAWATPVSSSEDLIVSVTLPPTLGNSALVNAIGLMPWPLYGATILEVWIRNGGTVSSAIPGWTQLSLAGQLGYNPGSATITSAGAHRLFFPPGPVREILVRLRPQTSTKLGLVNFDCWAVEFKPVGTIVLDGSQAGVSNIASATLSGLNPSSLSRLPVSRNGSQVTIDLSSATAYDSPVLTSVALIPVPAGQEDTGFDFDVFSP